MKINSSGVRNKLKSYMASESFTKKIQEHQKLNPANAVYFTASDIERHVYELKQLLLRYAQELTTRTGSSAKEGTSRLGGASPTGLVLTHRLKNVKRVDVNGKSLIASCEVELYFNPQWVQSPSLFDSNPGVDNLLRLLTNGWDFRGDQTEDPKSGGRYESGMSGTWYVGSTYKNPNAATIVHNVFARSYKQPSSELFEAVDYFNKKKARENIYAMLDKSYINVFGIEYDKVVYHGWYGKKVGYWDQIEKFVNSIGTIRFGLHH